MFFGAVVKPGRNYPLVPHAEGFALHLSQASLAADVKNGTRASVLVKLGHEDDAVVLCTLCAGTQDTVLLDQFMTEYAELSIQGSVPVHITGYYSPEYGPDGEDGEEEEDEEYGLPGHPMDLLGYGKHPMGDSESEEGESGDEDEDDSMDESEEDESSDDDVMAHRHKEPSVIIEDITDQEDAKAKGGMANGAAAKDSKKRKAAAALPATAADAAAAKKQAVTPQQQKQQQQAKPAAQEQPKQQKQQKQQQQQTPASKQQQKQQQTPADKQQQQKTPADKQQQKQQKQAQQTPGSTPAAAAGTPSAQSVPGGKKNVRVFENGFEIHNVKMGDPHGKLAKGGKSVKVRYVGRLKSNGRVFDKTDKKPFSFRLGVGEVIKGWDRGVEGMRIGDKRKLVIPPQMGYGQQRTGPIPANSWLEFDVELLDVK